MNILLILHFFQTDQKLRKFSTVLRVTGSCDIRTFDVEENAVCTDLVMHRGSPERWLFHDINLLNISGFGGTNGDLRIRGNPAGSSWGDSEQIQHPGALHYLQCSDLRMRIPFDYLPCDR
ncbi:piezo-type mechanosensitive ion channel homolog [Actinidia eriantha]|uniref:piezo-type mechanosensitive ion channel homolog n=1 Tax=Actinidia eriantha TaxID=165200 RepID=UPI00258C1327|nr:piezo-type mechanosensitive ion channel homolog [Actinidia eriantha]